MLVCANVFLVFNRSTQSRTLTFQFAPFALLVRSGRRQVAYSVQSIQANTYQAILGGSCTTCPSNTISAAGSLLQTDCLCKQGFQGADGTHCTPCAVAQYKDVDGSSECLSCPANTTSRIASTRKSDCMCLPGLVGAAGGPCLPCPESTYESQGVCINCPPNTFAPKGSVGIEACQCKLGFSGNSPGNCIECAHGFEYI